MENPAIAGFWLSPQQRRVWTLQKEAGAYRSVCLVSIEGPLSIETLTRALTQLVARHEILRTVYRRQPGMTFPFQVVLDDAAPLWEVVDLQGLTEPQQRDRLDEMFRAEQVRSIVPENAPVFAAKIANLGVGRSAVILSLPGMTADRRSLEILVRELGETAARSVTAERDEPLRYAQFAQWQNDLVEGNDGAAAKGREFWKKVAEAAVELPLPNDRRTTDEFSPRQVSFALDGASKGKIESLAAKLGASSAEVLFAAWQALLSRLTGQTTFKTGMVFAGREYDELRDAVGLIEKTIPIESRFDGDFRFREAVDHVRMSVAQAAEWQEHYVPGSGFGDQPPVSFEYIERSGALACDDSSLTMEQVFTCGEDFRLKLSAVSGADELALHVNYDGSRFDRDGIERISGYYRNLLLAAMSDPESKVSRLPLLPETERRQLIVEWNQTVADYPRDKCLHELFETQVSLGPDRPAVRFNENLLSYRELNARANQVAHFLRTLGVGPNSLVGLCTDRSAEMVVALLGILKAGGAYVPLNPDNPRPRLAQQLSGAVALITEQKLLEQMPEFAGRTLCLDGDSNWWSDQPKTNSAKMSGPEDLAYVIYTSGSTGTPKGVAVSHRNLVNYSHFITRRLGLDQHGDGLNFGTVSTISADLGNTCIFPALISGGCLHVISYEVSTDAQHFASYTGEYPLDVLKIVPSHLHSLLQSAEARRILPRKYLVLGGETLTPGLLETIESLDPSCEIFNHYGPTETTVGSLTLRLHDYDRKKSPAASIPIGRPIANTQVYILDPLLQPMPVGVAGELYIAGDGVTTGYLNQPERTAERFVANPFVNDAKARMYRTGDMARYLPDGNIEFLGRGDDQVKIRGFRVELGEIESVLLRRAGVKQAVVVAKEDDRGDKRLVAYVVADRDLGNSPGELRSYLKEQLPDIMVPSAVGLLPRIPLTANGKIDRQALPEPEAVEKKSYVAPCTPTETGVASIWTEVLRREQIGTDENFFDLGGHSLLATQVISRVRERFRIEMPIRSLFDNPTIAGLAGAISSADHSTIENRGPAIVRVPREQYRSGRS